MKIAKKIIVSVLAAAMIVTGCPSHYVKADTAKKQVTLSVQSQTAKPGATVDVTVDVKDNPGILGAAVSLKYDEGLTLTDATAGDAFSSLVLTKPGKIQSPCKFVWDGQEITADDIKDGTILKLSFKVSDDYCVISGKECEGSNNGAKCGTNVNTGHKAECRTNGRADNRAMRPNAATDICSIIRACEYSGSVSNTDCNATAKRLH